MNLFIFLMVWYWAFVFTMYRCPYHDLVKAGTIKGFIGTVFAWPYILASTLNAERIDQEWQLSQQTEELMHIRREIG